MTSTTAVQIPGYVAGTWDIDPAHSTVGFAVRHMMVSKVRGYFREFSGEIVTAEDPAQSTVTATIDMASIDTRQEQRDAHIKSAGFSGKTEISRKEFGVDIDMPMDGGGVVVGDKIAVELEIEAVLRAA